MPQTHGIPTRERLRVQFAEADVEIGFRLADMAEAEAWFMNYGKAARIPADADEVFVDLEQILQRLGMAQQVPFAPLVEELRRTIGSRQAPHSESAIAGSGSRSPHAGETGPPVHKNAIPRPAKIIAIQSNIDRHAASLLKFPLRRTRELKPSTTSSANLILKLVLL